jgi:hypothetical protein
MEIQALRLLITEQDLADLAGKHLILDEPIRDLKFRLTPQGVAVTGVYEMLMNVSFETLWEPGIQAGKLTVRLARFKALGIPLMLFRKMLLEMIRSATPHEDCVWVQNDVVFLDADRLLAREGVTLRTNLTAVSCRMGQLVLESVAVG